MNSLMPSGTSHNPIVLGDVPSTTPISYDDTVSSSHARGDLEIIGWSSSINSVRHSEVCFCL